MSAPRRLHPAPVLLRGDRAVFALPRPLDDFGRHELSTMVGVVRAVGSDGAVVARATEGPLTGQTFILDPASALRRLPDPLAPEACA